jgi:hypothetical protein
LANPPPSGTQGTASTKNPNAADQKLVSLAQVLLAPLDALFQAQVHAGRSFLNFLLQLSYRDRPDERKRDAAPADEKAPKGPDTIFTVDFVQEVPGPIGADGKPADSQLQKVSIPALALVPMRPLAIEEAEVNLAMEVTEIGDHQQLRSAEAKQPSDPPPWWLVPNPISLKGHVGNASESDRTSMTEKRMVQIKVKVGSVATPAGLEKLLTTLTQSAQVQNFKKP